MTKMTAMRIYNKNLKKSPPEPPSQLSWLLACVMSYNQACSNDDPKLSLTYSMARSYLVPHAFEWEISETMHFSKKCSLIWRYCMILSECQRSRLFIDLGPRSVGMNFWCLSIFQRASSQDFSYLMPAVVIMIFFQTALVDWSRWALCPYMIKPFENLLWNYEKGNFEIVYKTLLTEASTFIQMTILSWPLTYLWIGQFDFLKHLLGKFIEKLTFQTNVVWYII